MHNVLAMHTKNSSLGYFQRTFFTKGGSLKKKETTEWQETTHIHSSPAMLKFE